MLLALLLACAAHPVVDTGPFDCDEDGVRLGTDCDDADPDEGGPRTFHADADGDGYGDPGAPIEACFRRDGTVTDATDCDDADGTVHPGAQETCDGRDDDCDGAMAGGEEDADGDGWPTCLGDCDDADAERFPDHGCRPDPGCTHPSVTVLESVANLGISDILFDTDCNAWLPSLVTYDSLQVVHPSGVVLADWPSYRGITDLHAVALDATGTPWLEGWDDVQELALTLRGDVIEPVAEGTHTEGSAWIDVFLNEGATSVAHDGTCFWVPNLSGNGTLDCVLADGTVSTLATLPDRVEGIALAPDGALLASTGTVVYALDTGTGDAEARVTLSATVLDLAVDYDGTLYVETVADEILRVPPDGAPSTFVKVAYDGKIVVSPDGWLVRVMPYWNGGTWDVASLWEEWELGD